MFVEGNIIVAHQMVSFFARRLRCLAVAVFQPRKHRFTDVNTPVVDNVRLYHAVTAGSYYIGKRISQQVVTDVSQMERLIGIGRGVFNHYQRGIRLCLAGAESRVGMNICQ